MKHIRNAFIVLALGAVSASAQTGQMSYPRMAPIAQYLLPRDREIALARSAAPESIGRNAEVMILTKTGFTVAEKGSNGFVCMVARSWSAEYDDPDFWNPKVWAPNCYNAIAAPSQVAATEKRTAVALAGGSAEDVRKAIRAAIDSGELPKAKPGSMSYMLSKQQYLDTHDGHWMSHLMFYSSDMEPAAWGAGVPGSPIMGVKQPEEHLTVFLVPLPYWSDGTPAPHEHH